MAPRRRVVIGLFAGAKPECEIGSGCCSRDFRRQIVLLGSAWGRVLQHSATGKKGARRPRHGTRRAPIASSADRLRIGSVVYATCSSAVRAHQAFPELATDHEKCPETTSPPAYALRIWYATRCGPHRPHGSLQTIFWQIRKECRCIHAFPSRPARRFHEWRRRRPSAEG